MIQIIREISVAVLNVWLYVSQITLTCDVRRNSKRKPPPRSRVHSEPERNGLGRFGGLELGNDVGCGCGFAHGEPGQRQHGNVVVLSKMHGGLGGLFRVGFGGKEALQPRKAV